MGMDMKTTCLATVALVAAIGVADDVIIENAALRLVLSGDGAATSLVTKATGEECLAAGQEVGTTWFFASCGGILELPRAFWAQTEEPSGGGAASPRQGRWDPASLRPALRLGRAAGRAAGLAGGRPWAGPPAPRVAVQVGTMTLSRHASFSHSNFGATGQRGRFIIVGLDQQPALPEPRCPRPAQAPGLGRPTAQLGQSPATLSPLAQPHPSRDPLAFLAFCPFGLSRSWARAML